jgi:phosphatidylglycerophosphate synthase
MDQLLDAMDGTMARMFKMHTEFGAKLDEFTDIFFGVVLALSSFLVSSCARLRRGRRRTSGRGKG